MPVHVFVSVLIAFGWVISVMLNQLAKVSVSCEFRMGQVIESTLPAPEMPL